MFRSQLLLKKAKLLLGIIGRKLKKLKMKSLIAGSPPNSLSLIVGRSKYDTEASVTRQTFFFSSENKSHNPPVDLDFHKTQ